MKTIAPLLLATAAALAISTGSAQAVAPFTLTFDSLPSGSAANLFAPIGLDIRFGVIALNEDLDGLEIPGTEHWVIDTTAPDVLAQNPTLFSYGPRLRRAMRSTPKTRPCCCSSVHRWT